MNTDDIINIVAVVLFICIVVFLVAVKLVILAWIGHFCNLFLTHFGWGGWTPGG